ncbi:hypothetical protein P153DRAFT_319313 [Dothidotthia symphoricarpi CBS 119687]|uniref:SP-RING-type domain-containing protein n=1 Tax=Dothidotthia symphoricarpi CBS 119687 TaxID=1392245 RepID=A0A6A6AAE8_9PLEO|nr:uncharacterized protein P153DRAFT_319313 [Dothidotthia symphoricarpi CBS 119687]KAF2128064.1 hypothetical protein P153DRAFT_319313 [Dothidotthia symphoricarpi CBS 119687]
MKAGGHALPNDLHAAEAATASTLHYALGNLGHKQKSWMTPSLPANTMSAPSPPTLTAAPPLPVVRKRGRPPKPRPLVPSNHRRTTERATSLEPQAERQPASSPTSPHLANIVTRQDNPTPSSITVFPSPTPSEESTNHASTPATYGDGNAVSSRVDYFDMGSARANNAQEMSVETRVIDSVGRLKRAAAGHGQPAEKRKRVDGVTRRPSGPYTQHGGPSGQFHSRGPFLGNQPNSQIPSPQPVQDAYVLRSQIPETTPRAQDQFSPLHPPSRAVSEAQQSSASGSNWYTVHQCLTVFDKFRASFTAMPKYPRDLKRMEVLRDATCKQDWAYLTMHQYYCLFTYMPTALPEILRCQPNLPLALQSMRNVLDVNDHLSPAVLHFFSNYPFPMDQISTVWPHMFERQAQSFMRFVGYSANYDQLRITCERRKCPPNTRELVELGIVSTTFQRLLFTAFLRRLWQAVPPQQQMQKQFEDQAVDRFVQDQAQYLQREALLMRNLSLGNEPPPRDQGTELRRWDKQFKQLAGTFGLALEAQGSSLTNPQERRHSHLQAYPQQQLQQQHQQHQQRVSVNNAPHAPHSGEMRTHISSVNPHTGQVLIQQIRGQGYPHQPPSRAQTHQRQRRTPLPLLAHPGQILPQQRQPYPARFSLHQAYLRSPILQAQNLESPLYHYVHAFAIRPARLSDAGRAIERWTFHLAQSELQCIPRSVASTLGAPETRAVEEVANAKTIRLRCVKWPSENNPDMHSWTTTDTCWIPHSYFTFNETHLEQRKKVHHGKDLPIDITRLLREGENVLETTVTAMSNDTSYLQYLVAIEVLGVMTHESIKQHSLDNVIPAEDTKKDIRKRLSGASIDNDDDDFTIVESNLTINLFDPFSASRFCDIPVRSKACSHIDCFDLETFLQTRRRKGDASVSDQWRCPICNADARPPELVVDGFLVEVRKELEKQGLATTRAIIVDQDGTWKPKKEVRDPNGVQDRETPEASGTPTAGKPAVPTSMEIIDLSD